MASSMAISGPGGRRLEVEVEVAGPDAGRAVVFHNGTPGAGSLFAPLVDDQGHLSISLARYGDVLDALIAAA